MNSGSVERVDRTAATRHVDGITFAFGRRPIVVVKQYFVREFGHHFYIMNRGQVVAEGATAELTPDVVAKHLSV